MKFNFFRLSQINDRVKAVESSLPWHDGYPNAGRVHPTHGQIWDSNKDLVASELKDGQRQLVLNAPGDLLDLVICVRDLLSLAETVINQRVRGYPTGSEWGNIELHACAVFKRVQERLK